MALRLYIPLLLACLMVNKEANAQHFNYLLPPSISEADDLNLTSADHQSSIYAVKVKGKWGIKNTEDQTMIPITFDSVRIDEEVEMIIAYRQNNPLNYSLKGKLLSYLETDSLLKKRDVKIWRSQAEKLAEKLMATGAGYSLDYSTLPLPDVIIKNKNRQAIDTLRLQVHTDVMSTQDGLFLINGSIFNDKGEKVKTTEKYTRLIPVSTGHILAKSMGFWGLLNRNARQLLPCAFASIDTLGGYPLFILERNNQFILSDTFNKRIYSQAAEKIYKTHIKGQVVFYFPDKTISYDAASKSVRQWDFVLDKPLGETGLWLIKKYGLYGCANITTGEEVIPAKYAAVWEEGEGYIIGADGNKHNGMEKAMDVYYNHKLVHQARLIQFLPFAGGILTIAEAQRCVLNPQFLTEYCIEKGTFYAASRGQLISAYSDETGPGVYLASHFKERYFKKPYETAIDLKQLLTVNNTPGVWVRYANSWGVIDYQGNVLIDFQWDEMKEIAGIPQVFKVKKAGKWGFIKVMQ